MMERRRQLLDDSAIERSLTRMAHEIVERNRGLDNVVLVGIITRGRTVAQRLSEKLETIEGVRVPVFPLDPRPYRDDVPASRRDPVENLPIEGKIVVLVDDVLFTGRTVRSALDAIMVTGRAQMVQLAAFIDRGHRELPIRPDFVGKNIPSSRNEEILVRLHEDDGEDGVWIATMGDGPA